MMKEEITNIIRTFEAVGPVLGNALKSGQLFNPQCELTEPAQDVLCEYDVVTRGSCKVSRRSLMNSQKVGKHHFPSFRRKPESSLFNQLRRAWTPVFTGVTTFYEIVKF